MRGRRRERATGPPEALFCCAGCRLASKIAPGGPGAGADDGPRRFLEARLLVSAFLAMGTMEFTLVLYGESVFPAAPDPATVAIRRVGQVALAFLSFPVLILLGVPLLRGAWADLRRAAIRMDGLIVLATFAAFGLSLVHTIRGEGPVYYETATMVLVLVMFGRRLEAYARTRGRDAAKALREILPRSAHRIAARGLVEDARPEDLRAGDRVRVLPGEAAPADLKIVFGTTDFSAAHVTGEEAPRPVGPGDPVAAGAANGSGLVEATVERPFQKGSLGRILDLLEAPLPETRTMRQVDRLAGTLALVAIVLATAGGVRSGLAGGIGEGITTSLSVLLVACPCALGLATPLAWRAIRAALTRRGVLVRDPAALEVAPRADHVLLDKTGTLTDARAPLVPTQSTTRDVFERLSELVASSGHALGRGLPAATNAPENLEVVPGRGVVATVLGARCRAGSPDWMASEGCLWDEDVENDRERLAGGGATLVAFSENERVTGLATLSQRFRPEAVRAVRALKERGLEVSIVSGDRDAAVAAAARELGVPGEGGLEPEGKVARLMDLQRAGRCVLAVGDGVNDAPLLRLSDVSVAMGSGTAAARQEAQIEVVGDDLRALPAIVDAARALRKTVRGNVAWTLLYNGVALGLAVTGRLSPPVAALAMVASSIAVSFRSWRLLGFGGARWTS